MSKSTSFFRAIKDGKTFERLCADLLEAEGFELMSEPYVDRTGVDLVATEDFRSHASGQSLQIRWRVQCKHYAGSGRNLGRTETEEIIHSYQAARAANEGLFIILSTDYTEAAKTVIDLFIANNPSAHVMIWNQRQLTSRLERYGTLLQRYGLDSPAVDFTRQFATLRDHAPAKVLMVSDQSSFAHQMTSGLRRAGLSVAFLSPQIFDNPGTASLLRHFVFGADFRLVVCFLGDTFGKNLPRDLATEIISCHKSGAGLLWLPFLAWSIDRGLNTILEDHCPVELVSIENMRDAEEMHQISSESRWGDFRIFFAADAFVEDQYTELDAASASAPFGDGIDGRFGFSHSYEFIQPKPGSTIEWSDTGGNPVLVTKRSRTGRIAYLNSCSHVCMSVTPAVSPLESSRSFGDLLANTCSWLLST